MRLEKKLYNGEEKILENIVKSEFKVGDRVIRLPEHKHGFEVVSYQAATLTKLVTDRTEYTVWEVLTDSGKKSQWSSLYFRELTPLEEALL